MSLKVVCLLLLVLAVNCYASCEGDPNAETGCSLNCNRHCSDINSKKICPRIYCPPGCQCKDGYYYDNNSKKCVNPENCPKDQ